MNGKMVQRILISALTGILILLPCQTGWAYIYTLSDSDGLQLKQYNEVTGAFIKNLQTPPHQIPNSIFSGPNDHLYTVTQNIGPMGAITRYDGVTGEFIDYFTSEMRGPGAGTKFGPDGNIYSRGNYNSMDQSFIHKLDGNTGAVIKQEFIRFPWSSPTYLYDFGPEGYIFVGDSSGIKIFNGTYGNFVFQLPGLPGAEYLTFGPNNNMYGVNKNKIVKYKAYNTGFGPGWKPPEVFAETHGYFQFGPDGNLYVANPELGKLSKYDGQTGAYIKDMFSFASGQDLMFTFAGGDPVITPEPVSSALMLIGGGAMALARRKTSARPSPRE